MMWYTRPEHPLRRMFAALTEQTFEAELGVADPPLVDYLSEMLARFVHIDGIFKLKNMQGHTLEQVADMMIEAEAMPPGGRTRREVYRHIGDFTLFWTGVYPEILHRIRSMLNKDHFIDYAAQGKRSYYIASTFDASDHTHEARVLRRLSDEYELCAYGLSQVRREWETLKGEGDNVIMH
jgi:hypothetical protein